MDMRLCRQVVALGSLTLAGCASFSATRSAVVDPGIAFHAKGARASAPSRETYWFYDLGDCSLCASSPISSTELGLTYGSGRRSIGLFLNGPDPQLEVYTQLHEGRSTDYGVGGRVGLFPGPWRTGQLFFRLDRQLSRNVKLLVDPGLFYNHARSPNGWNHGSLLFFTPSVGLAIKDGPVTLTPSVTVITGGGNLSISRDSRQIRDTFVSGSIGLSIGRRKK
jgi:hypothetical protein